MGCTEASSVADAASRLGSKSGARPNEAAHLEYVWRGPAPRGADAPQAQARKNTSVRTAVRGYYRAERNLVRRFQGAVPNSRRASVLPADRHGCLQPEAFVLQGTSLSERKACEEGIRDDVR